MKWLFHVLFEWKRINTIEKQKQMYVNDTKGGRTHDIRKRHGPWIIGLNVIKVLMIIKTQMSYGPTQDIYVQVWRLCMSKIIFWDISPFRIN